MEGISEHQNCFLIDLRNQQAYCRLCRKACKRLELKGFTQFWCANHDCDNAAEVRLDQEGTWSIYYCVETWFANHCSGFSTRQLISQIPSPGGPDPRT